MEIERKYLISRVPDSLTITNTRLIEQGYLNTAPVIRIRKDNDQYELTLPVLWPPSGTYPSQMRRYAS